jgi:hypothetical protein
MREKPGPGSLPAPSVKQRNLLLGGQQLDRGCNQAISLIDIPRRVVSAMAMFHQLTESGVGSERFRVPCKLGSHSPRCHGFQKSGCPPRLESALQALPCLPLGRALSLASRRRLQRLMTGSIVTSLLHLRLRIQKDCGRVVARKLQSHVRRKWAVPIRWYFSYSATKRLDPPALGTFDI